MRKGILVPQPCEDCGSTENVEMHHEDYDKVADVRWLCAPCHRLLPKDDILYGDVHTRNSETPKLEDLQTR